MGAALAGRGQRWRGGHTLSSCKVIQVRRECGLPCAGSSEVPPTSRPNVHAHTHPFLRGSVLVLHQLFLQAPEGRGRAGLWPQGTYGSHQPWVYVCCRQMCWRKNKMVSTMGPCCLPQSAGARGERASAEILRGACVHCPEEGALDPVLTAKASFWRK